MTDFFVKDLEGKEVSLASISKKKPTLFIFVRHFGWIFCREQAVQVHREREAFEKLGASAVVIGHSSLRYAKAFLEETKIELPVYVDEKRVVYQALEFKRPLLSFLTPKVFKRAAEARKNGFTQPGVHGDAFQLGGVILQMPDGSMPYKYASQFAGDHPRLEDLKEAVRKAIVV